MLKFVAKRLLSMIPIVIGATLIVFLIMSLTSGDPAQLLLVGQESTPEQIKALRTELGLDDPVYVQYARYMVNLCKGDMGISYRSRNPVSVEIAARLPNTLRLALVSMTLSVILALPLGIVAAIRRNTLFDWACMLVSLVGISMPIFWLGLLLILMFSLRLGWFPVAGADKWNSIVLPALALAVRSMASIARTTRSSMLEVIRQDYIRTARCKGIPERLVIRRHALKNALLPTITIVGLQMGSLMAGSVLTETVFAWPGIGRLMIQSIMSRDTPTVIGCIVVFAITFSIVNLAVDLLYGFVDPRMRSMYAK